MDPVEVRVGWVTRSRSWMQACVVGLRVRFGQAEELVFYLDLGDTTQNGCI